MNTTYIYPQNLKATANMWLWSLRDFAILSVSALLSVLILTQTKLLLPLALSIGFGFLSIRIDETTMMDYIRYAVRYFLSTQQHFEWR
jgi:hypothetical protein